MATKKEEILYPVETHRDNTKLDPVVFAGVCAMQKWQPGKQVSKQEFDDAVLKFIGQQKKVRKLC